MSQIPSGWMEPPVALDGAGQVLG